jgi:dTDP-4-dehydrorhamnose reductase
VYSDHGSNFLSRMLRSMRSGQPVDVVADQRGSPTWSAALARITASALGSIGVEKGDVAERIREVAGIYHMAGEEGGSRYDFARAAIAMTNSQSVVRPVEHAPMPGEATRPRDSRLSSRHVAETFSVHVGHWREQLAQCLGVGSERVQRHDGS